MIDVLTVTATPYFFIHAEQHVFSSNGYTLTLQSHRKYQATLSILAG